ncbi:KRFB protein, partial [Crypturellus undulatus]|nr:KRFB protein [Crypturellus undulatus]
AVTCPQPIAESYNEPCVQQCSDSRAIIFPPPVAVTLPGPVLSSFPQDSIVGSLGAAGVGSTFSSWGSGRSLGYGSSLGS